MKKLINLIILLSVFVSIIFPQKTIAVLDFTTEGLENISISALPILVSMEISKTKKYRLIERAAMKEIMKEQKFQLSGCVSSECAVEVGQLMGAEKMVTGTISALGDLFIIEIRLIDVETGEIENNEMIEHIGKIEDLLTPIKKASRKLFTSDVEELAESHIYIKSDPIGAKVYMNGILEGSSPLRKTVKEGNHEVVVKASGYADWSQNISSKLNETIIVDAVLMEVKSGGSSQVPIGTNSGDVGKWEVLGINRDDYIQFLRLGINERKWIDEYQPTGITLDLINIYTKYNIPNEYWVQIKRDGITSEEIAKYTEHEIPFRYWTDIKSTMESKNFNDSKIPFKFLSNYAIENIPDGYWEILHKIDVKLKIGKNSRKRLITSFIGINTLVEQGVINRDELHSIENKLGIDRYLLHTANIYSIKIDKILYEKLSSLLDYNAPKTLMHKYNTYRQNNLRLLNWSGVSEGQLIAWINGITVFEFIVFTKLEINKSKLRPYFDVYTELHH